MPILTRFTMPASSSGRYRSLRRKNEKAAKLHPATVGVLLERSAQENDKKRPQICRIPIHCLLTFNLNDYFIHSKSWSFQRASLLLI
jgi:hypothetical protein